jgi:hypothetical protein
VKILVIDTVGNIGFSRYFMDYFPGIDVTGFEPTKALPLPHPHGFQCGYYAGVLMNLLPKDEQRKLIFCRIFDDKGKPLPGSDEFMLQVIAEAKPDVVTRSWGLADGDRTQGDMTGRVAYGPWVEKFRALQEQIGFVDFGAAGNSDANDADVDVDFPQRLMPDICNIIGSHNKSGIPSRFSGDGAGVQCTFWAEDVALCTNGFWQHGSGTSFATPKAAGLCGLLGLKSPEWRAFVQGHASRPKDWKGEIPHPKWGYGSLEKQYQLHMARLPARLWPVQNGQAGSISSFQDFEEIYP